MCGCDLHERLIQGIVLGGSGGLGAYAALWWTEPQQRPAKWWAPLVLIALVLAGSYAGGSWHLSATNGNTPTGDLLATTLAGTATALVLGIVMLRRYLRPRTDRAELTAGGTPGP